MTGEPPFVIALDGPAASGKSSVGLAAAQQLGFRYFDTGLLYRVLTWLALSRGIEPSDGPRLQNLVAVLERDVDVDPAGRVFRHQTDLTALLHQPPVDAAVSAVSAHPAVREAMRPAQRALVRPPGLVMAGRDIGTVIVPEAPLKIWLNASLEERARRRASQSGQPYATVLEAMQQRDRFDASRDVAPMTRAADAVEIETDDVDPEAIINQIVSLARGSRSFQVVNDPRGLLIETVEPGSALDHLGVRSGDRLLAIDDLVPRDVIDLQLELPEAHCLALERDGRRLMLRPEVALDPAALGLAEAVPGGIRECNNHCEFCFIRALPGGLRPSLYLFDDDYRYSFLWGNFLTLTNLDQADWARIGYQRLSPLNVSVHATDPDVRRKMLGNRHAPDILPQLGQLARQGIRVNAQVVLCAGLNDGRLLDRTIDDLARLYPSVQSLSVVPVGITRYSRVKNIRRPTPAQANVALEQCERWQAALRPRLDVGFVYASDELYMLAGRDDVPSAAAYDGFPVLSNGVGLLRSMLDEWRALLDRPARGTPRERKVAWLTGRLAAPALERMADEWRRQAGWRPQVNVVDNLYFGQEVTVSGLLCGGDLKRALQALDADIQDVVLPRGPFGFDGRATLDGVSAEAVGAAHPGRVHLASTPRELLDILRASSAAASAKRLRSGASTPVSPD